MASTKTGLNIGADATVVAAAGQLAKAQQPFSMKGMTDNFVKTRGEFMESQTKQYEERMKEIEALNDGVKTAIAELETQLNDGTIDLQAERDILQLEVDGFRDRLQKVPRGKKGKKERDQILYEVNKMVKGRKKTGDAAADVIQTINNNLYQSNLLEPEFLGLITQMGLDGSKKEPTDDTFKKVKNSDGDYVYSYTHTKPDGTKVPVQGTIFEIQNKLKSAAPQTEFVTQVNESIFAQQADAVANPTVGFDVVYDRIINNLETSFNNNPDGFRGLIHSNVGWAKKSYVEALNDENSEEYKSIMNVLMEVQPSSLDLDGSGTVDGEDFASPENMSKMVNILTNPEPGQRRVAHALAAQFYADTEARRAYGIGTGSIQKTSDEKDSEVYNPTVANNVTSIKRDGKTTTFSVYYKDLQPKAKAFKLLEMGGKPAVGFSGEIYSKEGNKYYVQSRVGVSKTDDGVTKRGSELQPREQISRNEMLQALFLTSYLDDFGISASGVERQENTNTNLPSNLNVGVSSAGLNQPRVKLFGSSFDTRSK